MATSTPTAPKLRGAKPRLNPDSLAPSSLKRRTEKTNVVPKTRACRDQHLVIQTSFTDIQRAFVNEIIAGESVINACRRSGVAPANGYAYMKRPYFIEAIAEGKRKFEEDNKMTRQKVLDGLLEGIQYAKAISEPSTMISGWKTIGQMCGYFEPARVKVDVNVSGSVLIERLTTMSDEELLKIIEQGGKPLLDGPNDD